MAIHLRDVELLRRRVLNVVGHELRTPVSTLSGLAAQLEACEDDAQRRALTEALARNARRLDRLVTDLLLAAGITTVVPIGDPEAIELVAVAQSIWTGPPLAISGEATAIARPASIRRVLSEVLDNAKTYGTEPFTLTARTEDGRAVVEIANGGAVVTEEELDLAPELFFRGEVGVTSRAGLGVGLALARTLLLSDDGDITLRPRDAGGVVVRIELPSA